MVIYRVLNTIKILEKFHTKIIGDHSLDIIDLDFVDFIYSRISAYITRRFDRV